MPRAPYFEPELFLFLRQLKRNNNRLWFEANRDRYERHVRQPFLRFIADFGSRLHGISPHFVADPRPVGGSLFRLNRDTRFSADKSPYKTMVAAQFRHEDGRDVHAPGFYLHLEPGEVFAGTGLWRPNSRALARIRDAIVERPDRWRRILRAPSFRATFFLGGEKLERPPRGYDLKEPLIEDLKRKDFVATATLSEEEACSRDFLDRFAEVCRRGAGFVEFLTRALGLPF